MKICTECNIDYKGNGNFCTICGKKLEEKPSFCSNCGSQFSTGSVQCEKCGQPTQQKGGIRENAEFLLNKSKSLAGNAKAGLPKPTTLNIKQFRIPSYTTNKLLGNGAKAFIALGVFMLCMFAIPWFVGDEYDIEDITNTDSSVAFSWQCEDWLEDLIYNFQGRSEDLIQDAEELLDRTNDRDYKRRLERRYDRREVKEQLKSMRTEAKMMMQAGKSLKELKFPLFLRPIFLVMFGGLFVASGLNKKKDFRPEKIRMGLFLVFLTMLFFSGSTQSGLLGLKNSVSQLQFMSWRISAITIGASFILFSVQWSRFPETSKRACKILTYLGISGILLPLLIPFKIGGEMKFFFLWLPSLVFDIIETNMSDSRKVFTSILFIYICLLPIAVSFIGWSQNIREKQPSPLNPQDGLLSIPARIIILLGLLPLLATAGTIIDQTNGDIIPIGVLILIPLLTVIQSWSLLFFTLIADLIYTNIKSVFFSNESEV